MIPGRPGPPSQHLGDIPTAFGARWLAKRMPCGKVKPEQNSVFKLNSGDQYMTEFTRRTTLGAILAAGIWANRASAQTDKDLTVELAPQWHPRHRAVAAHGPVQVSLMPFGPSTLPIGEPLKFRMVSLADGYGHLYALSASGRSQLWLENTRIHAGVPIVFPRPGLIVRAAAPAGDEVVMFVATRSRIAGFQGGGSSSMPFDLPYSHDGLRTALQGQLDALPHSDWAVAEVTVRVHE
jgi:hypothetical protein